MVIDLVLLVRLRAAGCVFAEDEAALLGAAADSPAELEALTQRRIDGEPLEYILGWAEFCGLRIAVAPGVFVPRQRTEFLVRTAVDLDPAATSCSISAAARARSVPASRRCSGTSSCTPPTSIRSRSTALGGTCRRAPPSTSATCSSRCRPSCVGGCGC